METLPYEIIRQILMYSNLNIADVVNFSSTCHKFRQVVNSDESLWKTKYFQRWPKADIEIITENWYNECILRVGFEKRVQELLSVMCTEFFHLDMKKISGPELDFSVHLVNSHKYGYYYLRDFLIAINSLPLTLSLSNKYYGNILLKYIHKRYYEKVWNTLSKLSIHKQTLEKGAIFVAIWCQEYERGVWRRVTSELDDIADKVQRYLFQHFSDHPLLNTPNEIQSIWRNENLSENVFQPRDCKAVISAINYVLFEDLKYCVSYDFNETHKKCCGIDFALSDRKANPYMFAVIYESIARRLGVKLEILELPDDCLLRWKEDYSVANSRSHYITFETNGIRMTCLYPKKPYPEWLIAPSNMRKIAQTAAFFIHPREFKENHFSLRDSLELKVVIEPLTLTWYQQLSQIHMLHELNARELISKLKDIRSRTSELERREFQFLLHSLELYQQIWEQNHNSSHRHPLMVHNRVEGVDFAVGMIVRDKFRELNGIIHGWSYTDEEITKKNPSKVYYKVLVENGKCLCTSQENLRILHSPPFVSHPSIGRFFDEYCIKYYKPNKELQARYPQDMDALQEILKKDRQTHFCNSPQLV